MDNSYSYFSFVYDKLMDNIPYDEWTEFICSILKKDGINDGIIMELGCGTGQMTERLFKSGYDMIGIDNSAEMLDVAEERLSMIQSEMEKMTSILYLNQDMREFELYGTVRAIYSVCDSLNYITKKDDLLKVFKLVNNYLDPQGLFIFDFHTEYYYKETVGDNTIAEVRDEVSFIWENRYNEADKINNLYLTLFLKVEDEKCADDSRTEDYVKKGAFDSAVEGYEEYADDSRTEDCVKEGTFDSAVEGDEEYVDEVFSEPPLYERHDEVHVQRAYSLDEIRKMLDEAGLVFIEAYDANTKDRPDDESDRIIVVARENGKSWDDLEKFMNQEL